MAHRKNKKNRKKPDSEEVPADSTNETPSFSETEEISVGQWSDEIKPVKKRFPGPAATSERLRVAMDTEAYADLFMHARASLDSEVCGVLAGQVCQDDKGIYVEVEAVIRGTSTQESSRHVTFTQKTWNQIHDHMKENFPDKKIIGWYHSHPGFGVEFSEMDLFIHRNFFPSLTQIALVVDPLGTGIATCVNTKEGIRYLERIWIGGKEQRLFGKETTDRGPHHQNTGDSVLSDIENRLTQLLQAIDDQRAVISRVLMSLGVGLCIVVVFLIGFNIYRQITSDWHPPELQQYVKVPVKINDKTVYLGIQVVNWEIPPELNAVHVQLEKERQAAIAEALKAIQGQNPATKQDENTQQTEGKKKTSNERPWWRRWF